MMDFDFSLPGDFGLNPPKKHLQLPGGASEVLLHCCCAPCSVAVLECLLASGIRPLLYFYNPNISPQDEYQKRRDEWLHLAALLGLESLCGDYDLREWQECTRGLEQEPERGARCDVCFKMRLKAAALETRAHGLKLFTTTLASSRWKDRAQVDRAGFAAAALVPGTVYWDQDWRKGGLITRRHELIREIGFYNQQYCGCVFSLAEARKRHKKVPAGRRAAAGSPPPGTGNPAPVCAAGSSQGSTAACTRDRASNCTSLPQSGPGAPRGGRELQDTP